MVVGIKKELGDSVADGTEQGADVEHAERRAAGHPEDN